MTAAAAIRPSKAVCVLLLLSVVAAFDFRVEPDWVSWKGCISHHEAKLLVQAKQTYLVDSAGSKVSIKASIDLSKSIEELLISNEGVHTVNNELLVTWQELEDICNEKRKGCYSIYHDGTKPFLVSTLSKTTGIPASLVAPLEKAGAPTMVLGGFTMHRIVDTTPYDDTRAKIDSIQIFKGSKVLDTCCGLGYTAIEAATRGGVVTTVEFDPASLEICCHNPWSKPLFDNSLPITIKCGDAAEVIKTMPSQSYNVIVHDPPARALTRTNIYGSKFYEDCRRVLANNGVLFHYIGNPDSKESGRLYAGITKRLLEAGFANVRKAPRAFGLVASN